VSFLFYIGSVDKNIQFLLFSHDASFIFLPALSFYAVIQCLIEMSCSVSSCRFCSFKCPSLILTSLIVNIYMYNMILWAWLIVSGLYWNIIFSLQWFNVAVTRACTLLIVMGNPQLLESVNVGESL
jgi:hypothetical protein